MRAEQHVPASARRWVRDVVFAPRRPVEPSPKSRLRRSGKSVDLEEPVLLFLSRSRCSKTAREVAEQFGISRPVAYRVLARLEKDGYIERTTKPVAHVGHPVIKREQPVISWVAIEKIVGVGS